MKCAKPSRARKEADDKDAFDLRQPLPDGRGNKQRPRSALARIAVGYAQSPAPVLPGIPNSNLSVGKALNCDDCFLSVLRRQN